eukprot:2454270-Amphidinium_carterae.1
MARAGLAQVRLHMFHASVEQFTWFMSAVVSAKSQLPTSCLCSHGAVCDSEMEKEDCAPAFTFCDEHMDMEEHEHEPVPTICQPHPAPCWQARRSSGHASRHARIRDRRHAGQPDGRLHL